MGKSVEFNINKFERAIFSFTGKDEKLLLVKMPEKKVFDRMKDMQDLPDNTGYDELNEIFDSLLSDILSNNKQGKAITPESVRDMYDFEEKMEIFNRYMDFVKGATSDPN